MWLLGWLFEKIRHKEGLGFGDVKMIAMMGAFLGLSGVVVSLLLGSLLGSIGGYAWMKITRKDPAAMPPVRYVLGAGALIVVAAHGGILRLVRATPAMMELCLLIWQACRNPCNLKNG